MSSPFLIYKEMSPTSGAHLCEFFTPVAFPTKRNHVKESGNRSGKIAGSDGGTCDDEYEGAEYLFVAALSAISIYEVHRRISTNNGSSSSSSSISSTPYLSLVYHSPLFGTTRDLQTFTPNPRIGEPRLQYLLLSLDEGKFCVVHFDAEKAELHTISMFNAQEGAFGVGAIVKASKHGQVLAGAGVSPYVSCEATHGIGSAVLYGSHLMFFPLFSSGAAAGASSSSSSSHPGTPAYTTLNSPFLVDFFMRTELVGTIIDSCFLPGASVPTLVVLQEREQLPLGHAAAHLHTYSVSALAVDTMRKTVSVLWRQDTLPHDSIRLLALPGSPRGDSSVLLVTMNALLLLSVDGALGLAVNGFAATTVAPHIFLQSWPYTPGVELDGSRWSALKGRGEVIACLKDGQVLNVRLTDFVSTSQDIREVRMEPNFLCRTNCCSGIATNDGGDVWFFASKDAVCSLVHASKTAASSETAELYSGQLQMGAKSSLDVASIVLGGVALDIDAAGRVLVKDQAVSARSALSVAGKAAVEVEASSEVIAPPIAKKSRSKASKKQEPSPVEELDDGHPVANSSLPSVTPDALSAEERSLYGNDLPSLAVMHANNCLPTRLGEWSLTLVDSVNVLGPILGATFCKIDDAFDRSKQLLDWDRLDRPREKALAPSAASFITEREIKDGLQLSAGLDEQGSLVRVSQGRRFTKIAARTFVGITDVISVTPGGRDYTLVLMQGMRSRLLLQRSFSAATQRGGAAAELRSDASTKSSISSTTAEHSVTVTEPKMDQTGLDMELTLALAEALSGFLVQVTSSNVRLIALNDTPGHGTAVQIAAASSSLENGGLGAQSGVSLISADVATGLVAAVGSDGQIFLLAVQEKGEPAATGKKSRKGGSGSDSAGTVSAAAVEAQSNYGLVHMYDAAVFRSILPSDAVPVGVSLYCGYFPHTEPVNVHSDSAVKAEGGVAGGLDSQAAGSANAPGSATVGTGANSNAAAAAAALRRVQEEIFVYGAPLSELAEKASANTGLSLASPAGAAEILKRNASHNRPRSESQGSQAESIAESESSVTAQTARKGSKSKAAAAPKSKKAATKRPLAELESDASSRVEAERVAAESKLSMAVEPPTVPASSRATPEVHPVTYRHVVCPPSRYVLIWCAGGELAVIDVDTASLVFWSAELGLMPASLSVQRVRVEGGALAANQATFSSSSICAPTSAHNRGILCARAASLGRVGSPAERQRLLLTVVLKTGDLAIYVLAGANDGRLCMESDPSTGLTLTKRLFTKMNHRCVTRRRNIRQGGKDASASAAEYRLVPVIVGDRTSLSLSGSRPVLIQCEQGAVTVQPLCLPEVQYVNAGTMLVCQLQAGDIRGLVTLWQEPRSATSRNQSVLEMYQETNGAFTLPGSDLSFRRVIVQKTVKASVEFTERGDDKTEQELLPTNRRTFLLACSEQVQVPFARNVLSTDQEHVKQLKVYERYFDDLSSFCQPDINVGAAPMRGVRRDELVLMQSGEPVSSFRLPPGEIITAADVVCLSTEKMQLQMGMRPTAAGVGAKRRVFVVCGTCKPDPHGEDTPGEGRLLLLSLDYSVFQGDANAPSGADQDKENSAAVATIDSKGADTQNTAALPGASAGRAEPPEGFGAMITPKLRIQWSGPGASSVVVGFGEFVIATVDNLLYVYKMLPGTMELEQVAFWTASMYIKAVTVVKDRYFAVVDFLHSVQFLLWNQSDYSISLLGKDFASTVGLCTAFIKDGSSSGILLGDADANLQMFQYAPGKAESGDGTKLLPQADFHLGADPQVMLSHSAVFHKAATTTTATPASAPAYRGGAAVAQPVRNAAVEFGARMSKTGSKDITIVGTAAGSLGVLVPMEEKVYRRMALLQQLMGTVTSTVCGLNPREFRQMRSAAFKRERKHGILDGVLLSRYVCLESALQDELAAAMAVDTDLLLETLSELELTAAVF